MDIAALLTKNLRQYRVHILVFLLAFLVALTCAHPMFFFNDEWITGNQLAQLKEGHQPFVNEGKYGVFSNGTLTLYFESRSNYLGYSLFFPLVALPAEWLVYFFGDHFTFFITYLWTFLLIVLALVLNAFFPAYTYIRRVRWTTCMIVLAFASLFLNLWYYRPLPLTGAGSSPEIMALVLTNVLLFALLAVIVYELLRVITCDSRYAFFGSAVCLSGSSYFFWTTVCKDHILVAILIALILLLISMYLSSRDLKLLAGGFFCIGLLAWARPELGLFVFIAMCILVGIFGAGLLRSRKISISSLRGLLLTPFFTVLGAIPLFINNYLATRNIFIPLFALAMKTRLSSENLGGGTALVQPHLQDAFPLLLQVNGITIMFPYLSSLPSDLYGVLIAPQTGSMGFLPLIPVFIVAILVLPLLKKNSHWFNPREKMVIGALLLFALALFCAYLNRIYGLNHDLGILPDIRYLSPVYLPLAVTGLVIIKKVPCLADRPLDILAGMCVTGIVLIPISLAVILQHQQEFLELENVFSLIDHGATVCIVVGALISALALYGAYGYRSGLFGKVAGIIFALTCALPFIWQVNASFISLMFVHGSGGYLFWVPFLLKLLNVIAI